jgi:hypothetical protein
MVLDMNTDTSSIQLALKTQQLLLPRPQLLLLDAPLLLPSQ